MILDDATGDLVDLPCRSIRVGSYKSMPKERAKFTEKGIHLKVPDICSGMESSTVEIPKAVYSVKEINPASFCLLDLY